jgi:phosphoribosylformimino-5-aminoimidazole carboxamide ribotide isomerase
MKKVKVIPVIDIMNGLVVHAIEGKRDAYKPIENSVISSSPNPKDVLFNLYRYGFREIYIADLNAIMGRGSNLNVINHAVELGFNVMADIGREGLEKIDSNNIRYVIGTEYISYPYDVEKLHKRIVSLDCFNLETKFANMYIDALRAVEAISKIDVAGLIVLDLLRVGSMKGLNLRLIDIVRNVYKGKIYIGGGIRGREDVEALKRFDVEGVLVATAIHKGIILDLYI